MKALALATLTLFTTLSLAAPKTGDKAPAFSLKDANGKEVSLKDQAGKIVVLEWFNQDCPFVRKHYDSKNMQKMQEKYTAADKGVVWFQVISSGKKIEAAEVVKNISAEGTKATATLLDEGGKIGKAYGAKTTPHMFVIDKAGTVIYQGAIDDKASADQSDIPTSKNFVAAALDEALTGKKVATNTTKPYGCSVKY